MASTSTVYGHPGNTWGWAVQGGVRLLNFFQPKNTLRSVGLLLQGRDRILRVPRQCRSCSAAAMKCAGGFATDGVFVNGGGIEKTEAWGFQAAYEHFWNAQWRTAVVGGYAEVNYNRDRQQHDLRSGCGQRQPVQLRLRWWRRCWL